MGDHALPGSSWVHGVYHFPVTVPSHHLHRLFSPFSNAGKPGSSQTPNGLAAASQAASPSSRAGRMRCARCAMASSAPCVRAIRSHAQPSSSKGVHETVFGGIRWALPSEELPWSDGLHSATFCGGIDDKEAVGAARIVIDFCTGTMLCLSCH